MTRIAARFWSKVRKTDGCWVWVGKQREGYGRLVTRGRAVSAHRLSWELHFGEIPAGLLVCHRCDNPICVRPDHLFLGDDAKNCADREAKGRHLPHIGEDHGMAKLNDDSVRAIRVAIAQGANKADLAQRYGVTRTTIHWIAVGRTWKHVA